MKHLFLALLLCPTLCAAQGFPTRADDIRLSEAALDARLRGQILTFYDNGKSRYYEDGRYSYTFYGDPRESAGGYWQIREDGAVCVEYITGAARCDLYVENNGRLVLIDEKGGRYPVRPAQ